MKGIYLYGSGKRCRILYDLLGKNNIKIYGIVDSNPDLWGTMFGSIEIEDPKILSKRKDVNVCVTFYSSLSNNPVFDQLEKEYKISKDNIFTFHDILLKIYKHLPLKVKENINDKTNAFFDASWGLGLGGVEAWLKDLFAGMKAYEVTNVFLLTKSEQENMSIDMQSYIYDFFYERENVFSEKYLKKGIDFIASNIPCTMIFSRVNELMLSACLLKMKYPDKIRIIMVVHGSCDGMYKDILSYRTFIDHYVCVSSSIKKHLAGVGIDENDMDIMTAPLPDKVTSVRNYTINKGEPIRIGYAGRLEILHKRIDVLEKVIGELSKRNVNYIMTIVGDGSYKDHLKKFINKNKLENQVEILGTINRTMIPMFWQNKDIAINTSESEGRPVSNMEAMINAAVPVVTRTDGILDDVKDGINGYIVPVDDYVSMADKIEYLEHNRKMLSKMGQSARSEMLSKSSMKLHMEFWLKLLHSYN